MSRPASAISPRAAVSLTDVLDRLLTTGVVLQGEIVISVADVELLYAGVCLVLASTDTMRTHGRLG